MYLTKVRNNDKICINMNVVEHTVWNPDIDSPINDASVARVSRLFDGISAEWALEHIPVLERERDDLTDIDYVRIGTQSSSSAEVIAVFAPVANGISDHHIIGMDYLRRVIKNADIRDAAGDELSIMFLASPSRHSNYDLGLMDGARVWRGDFSPVGGLAHDIIRRKGFTKLNTAGHSLGGVIALASAGAAGADMDVNVVAPSDAVCSKLYDSLKQFAKDFGSDADNLTLEVRQAGLSPYTEALGANHTDVRRRVDDIGFALGALKWRNLQLVRGMQRATLPALLHGAAMHAKAVVMGHGSDDQLIADTSDTLRIMDGVSIRLPNANLELVEIIGGRHTWGDNMPLRAQFMVHAMRAVS